MINSFWKFLRAILEPLGDCQVGLQASRGLQCHQQCYKLPQRTVKDEIQKGKLNKSFVFCFNCITLETKLLPKSGSLVIIHSLFDFLCELLVEKGYLNIVVVVVGFVLSFGQDAKMPSTVCPTLNKSVVSAHFLHALHATVILVILSLGNF